MSETGDYYLVAYGKSGGVGSFQTDGGRRLRRGDRVVLTSARGQEVGTVLCPASIRQSRLAGGTAGAVARLFSAEDESRLQEFEATGRRLFAEARRLIAERALACEVLDVEPLLDGQAILQMVGEDADIEAVMAALAGDGFTGLRLEKLAGPEPDHADSGCGKPDCGKTEGGGCSSCGTGGCSSCGQETDLRPYFAHLRQQMETSRVALAQVD